MDSQNPESVLAIVATPTVGDLVRQSITRSLGEHKPERLGVKVGYLARLALVHRLKSDEIDLIVYARAKEIGSVVSFKRYIEKGCQTQEIYQALEARSAMAPEIDYSVSIGKLIKFARQFNCVVEEDGEALADAVLSCIRKLGTNDFGKFMYPDIVIDLVVRVAREQRFASYELALDFILRDGED